MPWPSRSHEQHHKDFEAKDGGRAGNDDEVGVRASARFVSAGWFMHCLSLGNSRTEFLSSGEAADWIFNNKENTLGGVDDDSRCIADRQLNIFLGTRWRGSRTDTSCMWFLAWQIRSRYPWHDPWIREEWLFAAVFSSPVNLDCFAMEASASCQSITFWLSALGISFYVNFLFGLLSRYNRTSKRIKAATIQKKFIFCNAWFTHTTFIIGANTAKKISRGSRIFVCSKDHYEAKESATQEKSMATTTNICEKFGIQSLHNTC